jgi:hypothetical protein
MLTKKNLADKIRFKDESSEKALRWYLEDTEV